jgi:hypothetical protein
MMDNELQRATLDAIIKEDVEKKKLCTFTLRSIATWQIRVQQCCELLENVIFSSSKDPEGCFARLVTGNELQFYYDTPVEKRHYTGSMIEDLV